jgi:hypothetical protein
MQRTYGSPVKRAGRKIRYDFWRLDRGHRVRHLRAACATPAPDPWGKVQPIFPFVRIKCPRRERLNILKPRKVFIAPNSTATI